MPLYEYECSICRQRFTMLQPADSDATTTKCPYCEQSEVKRIYSPFSSFSTGHYGGGCSSFG